MWVKADTKTLTLYRPEIPLSLTSALIACRGDLFISFFSSHRYLQRGFPLRSLQTCSYSFKRQRDGHCAELGKVARQQIPPEGNLRRDDACLNVRMRVCTFAPVSCSMYVCMRL